MRLIAANTLIISCSTDRIARVLSFPRLTLYFVDAIRCGPSVCDVSGLRHRHRQFRLIQRRRKRLDIGRAEAGSVGICDIACDRALTRGQPRRMARRQIE